MELTGIHHRTAISAAITENYRFYTETVGMRLVKRSVNQDDVSAYHLFYADAKGNPGTDLTFYFGTNVWLPGPAPAADQARLLAWELLCRHTTMS